MRKLLIGLGVVVAILVAAILVVPFFVPVGWIKPRIETAIAQATGRDFRIDGPLGLTVFPSVGVTAEQAHLANVAGGTAPAMVALDKLAVSLRLMPLLGGRIVIDKFTLVRPVINLEVDRQGRPNWVFAAAPPPADAPKQGGGTGGGVTVGGVQELSLNDVSLTDGSIVYRDDRTGTGETVSKINATVRLSSLDGPLTLDADAGWHDRKVTLAVAIDRLRAVIDGGSSGAKITLAGPDLRLALDGTFSAGTAPGFTGAVEAATPSIRNLAAWTGHKLDLPGDGLGPFDLKGKLAASPGRLALSEATLGLDRIAMAGNVTVTLGGARPRLDGALSVDQLDLNPYLPPPAPAPATAGAAPAPGAGGWSDAPIDASALKAADAKLALSTGGIKFRKIEIGKSVLDVTLADGHLTADLTQMALYGGAGQGRLGLDGSVPGTIGLDITAKASGVQAQPLLAATIDLDRLSGTGTLDLAVNGHGRSEKALIATLAGNGHANFADGAIRGIDLAGMARNIGSAFTGGGDSQKTDFSSLTASATIAGGILTNNDLSMLSPLLRVTGAGTVDMPQQTVDYRVEPKLVATLQGQGGAADANGLTVPVIVSGPWSHLSYKPDLEALLKQKIDPKALLGGLKGGASGLLPGGNNAGDQTNPSPKPADALKSLFGPH